MRAVGTGGRRRVPGLGTAPGIAAAVALTAAVLGCASAPPGDASDPQPAVLVPAAAEGTVRDLLDALAKGADFERPGERENLEAEPESPNRIAFVKLVDRRDFPLYKNLYANQVPLDPHWRITFDFGPEGPDRVRVVGRVWMRTRQPPPADWDEVRIRKGDVVEDVDRMLAEIVRDVDGARPVGPD